MDLIVEGIAPELLLSQVRNTPRMLITTSAKSSGNRP